MSDSKTLTDAEKEEIIAKVLETRYGKYALAKAMMEPISRNFGLKYPQLSWFYRIYEWFYVYYLITLDKWDASKFGKFINSRMKSVKSYTNKLLAILYWKLVMDLKEDEKKAELRRKELEEWRRNQNKSDKIEYFGDNKEC